ncbi:MAG: hypothetical protein ABS81_07370 [Pseudonocardia sp. SCN 72-86]|nr:MAG: hypothetical protein ABS81_07370 [Pseudonocardia sp. SCN 72-86]
MTHPVPDLFDYGPGWRSRAEWRAARDAYVAEHGRGSRHDLIPPERLAVYAERLARLRASQKACAAA